MMGFDPTLALNHNSDLCITVIFALLCKDHCFLSPDSQDNHTTRHITFFHSSALLLLAKSLFSLARAKINLDQ